MDTEENQALESELLHQPLPVGISAYKNHPLFALRRHLLKYEAVYPPDTPAIGFVRGEEVLSRSSVHVLHTREKWLQSVCQCHWFISSSIRFTLFCLQGTVKLMLDCVCFSSPCINLVLLLSLVYTTELLHLLHCIAAYSQHTPTWVSGET